MHVLLAYDGSSVSQLAADSLSALPSVKKVTLISIFEELNQDIWQKISSSDRSTLSSNIELAITNKAKSIAETIAKKLGIETAHVTKRGKPAKAIFEACKEQKIDLLVMGKTGHGSVLGVKMGSVSRSIVHRAPCPTLLIESPIKPAMHVLCASDGSEKAHEAIGFLGKLNLKDADYHIICASENTGYFTGNKSVFKDEISKAISEISKDLAKESAKLLKDACGVAKVTEHVQDGTGSRGGFIIDQADKIESDILVMGTRSLDAVDRFFNGSISNTVFEKYDGNLLIVP